MVIAFVLFFLAGVGFGYAAAGIWKLSPLLFPIALAIPPLLRDDGGGEIIARLIAALAVMFGGIVLGALLDMRESRESRQSAPAA